MKSCLAIVPARGGSKRIPRKNVKRFLGKPILHYSVTAALQSGVFSEVMVSTDDAEIAESGKGAGAAVPFMRSAQNANDFAVTADVILEVLNSYQAIGREFDYVCCIYPTAPFVTARKLENALKMLEESGADGIFPVSEFSFPILRSLNVDEQSRVSFNWPEHELTRSQDLAKAYQDSGQFYFLRVETFLKDPRLVSKNTLGLVVPNMEVQDIDNEEDWKLAEIKYSFLQAKEDAAAV